MLKRSKRDEKSRLLFVLTHADEVISYIKANAPELLPSGVESCFSGKKKNNFDERFKAAPLLLAAYDNAFNKTKAPVIFFEKDDEEKVLIEYRSDEKEIHIPGEYSIIDASFFECDKLESIVFEKGVRIIRFCGLQSDDQLKKLVFSDSVTHLGADTFMGHHSLCEVEFQGEDITYSRLTFEDTPWLQSRKEEFVTCGKTVIIYNGCAKSPVFTEKIRKIGAGAFENNEHIEELHVPDSIENLEPGCFLGCANLKNVYLPEKLCYLGFGAFDGCDALENVYLPREIEHCQYGVFDDDTKALFHCFRDSDGEKLCKENRFRFEYLD